MTDSQQRQTISSSLKTTRGNTGRYGLTTPPPAAHVSHAEEILGRRYGHVEIVSTEKRWNEKWNRCYVLTRCVDCGRMQWTNFGSLRRGKSNGCQNCSQPAPPYPKWLYKRVSDQKSRCTNPNHENWDCYGGRGITFDFGSPEAACRWIVENLGLPQRAERLEIDRVDNSKGYAPGNLRWVTRAQNCANRRNTRIVEWRPEDWPYARTTVVRMLRAGLTREQILDEAWYAVEGRRKNWRRIKRWFESMTSETPDPAIATRYRECSSTTAATVGA